MDARLTPPTQARCGVFAPRQAQALEESGQRPAAAADYITMASYSKPPRAYRDELRRTSPDCEANVDGARQKNLREMLNPMYQFLVSVRFESTLVTPPRAICPIVVPNESEKFNWNMCPPARFSMANPPWVEPGL